MSTSPPLFRPGRSDTSTPTSEKSTSSRRASPASSHTPPFPPPDGRTVIPPGASPPSPSHSAASGDMSPKEGVPLPANEGTEQPSSEGLLAPLPGHDWERLMADFQTGLKGVADEEAVLREEYDKWNWFYDLWSKSRSAGDAVRLSQEMATITEWTRLKEEVLERTRAEHTENMLAISRVLGIDPKSMTPSAAR